jgi:flagellar basal body rod protein FlgG
VEIMRQFEMLQKAISTTNEMNKRSVEEIARVSG